MENIYLYSQNPFEITLNKNLLLLDKNKIICLGKNAGNILIHCNNGLLMSNEINLQEIETTRHIKVYNINNIKLIEIIAITNDNIINKFTTKKCEVYVYENCVDICYNSKFYSYYYKSFKDNYVFEKNDILYIFNENNLLEFNLKNNSFNSLKIKNIAKNGEIFEILCEIPYNNIYFLLFQFNFNNNNLQIKTYKKGNLKADKYLLPFVLFAFCKNNIDSAKDIIDKNINYDNLQKYIQNFNQIIEINNTIYLLGNDITTFSCQIENNTIIDID